MSNVHELFPSLEKKPEMSGVDILVKQRELLQGAIEKNQQLALAFDTDSAERRFYDRQNDILAEEQLRVLFTLSHYQERREEEQTESLLHKLSGASKDDVDLLNTARGKVLQMNDFIKVLEEYRIDDEAKREVRRRRELEDALVRYE